MFFRSSLLAIVAVSGFTACNVDADGDGSPAHLDCDDTSAAINPDAPELCDGLDNDCNGIVDDDTTDAPTFFADFDGDGFGDPDSTTTDCKFSEAANGPDPAFQPFGFVVDNTDCDDALRTVNPDADERCDGIDNNCDGDIDGDDAIDKDTWFGDTDEDGFGDPAETFEACDQPGGYVADDTDCDDSSDKSNPGADEICDGDDNDCDGDIDEDDAIDADSWFSDADGDTFGDPDHGVFACGQPDGYVADMTDCNDDAATANPDGTEVCDGLDNDCNAATVEDGTVSLNATSAVYGTIQAAINASVEGDTVYVCAGEWFENLTISQAITLRSGTGPDNTTINAGGESDGGGFATIDIMTAETTTATRIEGFTVTGGFIPGETKAGGINALNSGSDLEVADCVVTDNEGYVGGLLGPVDNETRVSDSEFSKNVAYVGGGVVVFEGEVLKSRILDNEASEVAGGMYVGGVVDLTGTRIISNYAGSFGGGLYITDDGGDGEVTGGTILNNLSDQNGGGVALLGGSLYDAVVGNNRATDFGGGVYVRGGDIENTTIDGNSAPEGGGVYLDGDSILIDVDITDNTSTKTGGGVYQDSGDVLIENCAIEGNTATAGGGWHLVSGTLDVTTSDWGTTADSNDNDPDDLYSDASSTAYDTWGTSETFVCDSSGDCI